jgi:hypothetical protein
MSEADDLLLDPIASAVGWLRARYEQPARISDLVGHAGMRIRR